MFQTLGCTECKHKQDKRAGNVLGDTAIKQAKGHFLSSLCSMAMKKTRMLQK